MNEMFIDVAGSVLADMRVLIEGAVTLYEDDALPLNRLALKNDMLNAASAFDAIGVAMYSICQHVRTFQEAFMKEVMRQSER